MMACLVPPAVWASWCRCGAARYYPEARVEHGVVLVLFVRNYVDKVWVDMEYIGGGQDVGTEPLAGSATGRAGPLKPDTAVGGNVGAGGAEDDEPASAGVESDLNDDLQGRAADWAKDPVTGLGARLLGPQLNARLPRPQAGLQELGVRGLDLGTGGRPRRRRHVPMAGPGEEAGDEGTRRGWRGLPGGRCGWTWRPWTACTRTPS